jgi:hypothetical protein
LGEAMLGEWVCYGVVDGHRLAPTGRVARVWWLTLIALQCTIELTGKIERRDTRTQLQHLLLRFGVSAFFRIICLWV